jgi:L-lysine exporter family protein LysE/ArgO
VDLIDLAGALAMGLGLGVITGMPLGVINVAIVDAVMANERRHALGLGIGGAIADATHTVLALIGVGRVLTARPQYARWFAIVAAIVVVVFAVASWRRRRAPRSTRVAGATDVGIVRGVVSGLALTLPNPAALAAWVAVAAMIWPDATVMTAVVVAIGVGLGSAAWFTLLGRLIARVRPDHRALRVVPNIALAAFVLIAVVACVRAL